MGRVTSSLREAEWITHRTVVAWGRVLLLEEGLLLLFLALWQHGVWHQVAQPATSDFVSFYAAGQLALAGTPALAYDQAAHALAEQLALGRAEPLGEGYQYFFYPPVFLFVCAGLAMLPYVVANAGFQVLTIALFLAAMRGVLQERGWAWVAPVLAFPAAVWTVGVGQNAFLTAALFGGFTLMLDRRPLTAGVLLGLLCYKPHFGLLAPFALVAGRRRAAFAAAAATVSALVGLSVLTFGWGTWQAYLAAVVASADVYASGRIDFAGMVTVFGGARLLGLSAACAMAIQAAFAFVMAGLVLLVWRRGPAGPAHAAALVAATLLAAPMALLYDDLLLVVAMGWLARAGRKDGFLPWEKLALVCLYPMALLTWTIGTAWHIPLGPVLSAIVLSLALRRLWRPPARPACGAT